jgi:hypothetical protein
LGSIPYTSTYQTSGSLGPGHCPAGSPLLAARTLVKVRHHYLPIAQHRQTHSQDGCEASPLPHATKRILLLAVASESAAGQRCRILRVTIGSPAAVEPRQLRHHPFSSVRQSSRLFLEVRRGLSHHGTITERPGRTRGVGLGGQVEETEPRRDGCFTHRCLRTTSCPSLENSGSATHLGPSPADKREGQ